MANMTTSIIMDLVDRVSGPARRIQQALSNVARRAGLDRIRDSARRAGDALGGVMQRVRGMGERLAITGGLAAGAVWGLERFVSGVTDIGNEVQNAAGRLEVGTTWLQEWMAVGRQFGVSNDAIVDGFKELQLRADEFVMTGTGPAAEAFGRLGIGVEDLRKTGGDTAEMLELVRSRLGRLENEAARQRVFDEVFGGQGGEQLVEMLGASRAELEAMMRAAHERGEILSPKEIDRSRDYTRNMDTFRASLFGIQRVVVGDLLPAINDWLTRMRELASANRDVIADEVIRRLREFWEGLKTVGQGVSWLADLVGGFGNLALWVAGLLGVSLLGSLAAAGTAILTFGATLLLTPIGWFALAIGAIAGGAYLIYRNWDGISEWFSARWNDVLAAFEQGVTGIARLLLDWSPIGLIYRGIVAGLRWLGVEVPERFASLGSLIIDGLWGGLTDAWQRVHDWFATRYEAITGALGDLSLTDIVNAIVGSLLGGLSAAWSGVTGWLDTVLGEFGNAFGTISLIETGRDWIGGLWDGIAERWSEVQAAFNEGITGIGRLLLDWSPIGLIYRGIVAGLRALGVEVPDHFASLGGLIIDGLWGGLARTWQRVHDWFASRYEAITGALGDLSLTGIGNAIVGGLLGSLSAAWSDVTGWLEASLVDFGNAFGTVSLIETGRDWIGGLWDGIAERWQGLTGWLSTKVEELTGWMPDWVTDRLGIGSLSAPQATRAAPSLGAPAMPEGSRPGGNARQQTDVGGELRIFIDAEGRVRNQSINRNGPMDYSVESGLLGVMP